MTDEEAKQALWLYYEETREKYPTLKEEEIVDITKHFSDFLRWMHSHCYHIIPDSKMQKVWQECKDTSDISQAFAELFTEKTETK